jgi:hypothetical protein
MPITLENSLSVSFLWKLHIHQFHIAQTLETHKHSIEEEIRQQDKISIKRYLDITGLDYNEFMEFVDTLEIDYLRHGTWIIFDKEKIEIAKEDIRSTLLEQTQRVNQIILSSQNFNIPYKFIFSIAQELYNKGEIEGILYEGERKTLFYTIKGITNLIKKRQAYFSYFDLFPGKDLSEKDIELITTIVKKLLKEKVLKGKFDEKAHKFSSYDMIYARNTKDLLHRFMDLIAEITREIADAYQKVKELLLKQEEVIRPQIVPTIEKIIRDNQSYFPFWESEVDKFFYKSNKILNNIYPEPEEKKKKKKVEDKGKKKKEKKEKYEIQNEPEIQESLDCFDEWTTLFNTLDQKFPSVIYHQKVLLQEPNNIESRRALYKLLKEIRMD